MSKAGGNKGGTKTGGRGGAGTSNLRVRVKKKAGTIKESSRRWLERHLNEHYVHKSKQDGYRSRAAYKLIAIDDRYNLLTKGPRLTDLGAAPGGWSQIAAEIVGSTDEDTQVVRIAYLHVVT